MGRELQVIAFYNLKLVLYAMDYYDELEAVLGDCDLAHSTVLLYLQFEKEGLPKTVLNQVADW